MTTPRTAATIPRPGSASDLGQHHGRPHGLVVVDLEVFVHERLEIVRGNAADDDDLGRICEEVNRVMAREEFWIARQDRALRRILEVRFE